MFPFKFIHFFHFHLFLILSSEISISNIERFLGVKEKYNMSPLPFKEQCCSKKESVFYVFT